MAIIGTLRDKMGKWVAVFVFVAISAFILGDLLSNNSMIFNNDSVGEIGGHEISLKEYQNAIQEQQNNYILNFSRQPSERELISLRQQAWERLIARYAIETQYEEVGVEVTAAEKRDMIYGTNVDPNIAQAFTDPNTGIFDRNAIETYLQRIYGPAPADPQEQAIWQEERIRWEIFQNELVPGRKRLKYENLLIKSGYVTKAEAEREYHLQNDVAEVKYLFVPHFAISDADATVSDSELSAYYNKNKDKYRTEATRSIDYVRFPIIPSAADSALVREEMLDIKYEFEKSEDDSTYAIISSEGARPFSTYTMLDLPAFVDEDSLVEGNIVGPFLDAGSYKMYKVSAMGHGSSYSARARHILIRWENTSDSSKRQARNKATEILRDIRGGADFAAKARESSEDPNSAIVGGDLGWFSEGDMVPPFNDAVFNATSAGLVKELVETDFGYHIIDVTSTKDNRTFKIAVVERAIVASDQTINQALRDTELFAADATTSEKFEQEAARKGLNILSADDIEANQRNVGILGDARELVQWAFRDAAVGDVSDVIELEDAYVIAVLKGKTDKGFLPLADVKDQILPLARKEKKGELIKQKLASLNGTLEEMASAFGSDANVYTSSDLKLSSTTMTGVNFDPKAVGLAFSLKDGERSKPFSGENGVLIIEMIHKTVAPDLGDYSIFESQARQRYNPSMVSYNISEALKELSDIDDKRYKFY